MADLFNRPAPVTNIPEMSVSELSAGVKRTIESAFGYVRVRGEISKVTLAKSGHLYTTLKDENAALDAVAWKATVLKLSIKPEEGMDVIATGRLTTYPGRSNYQLIIESLELAGQGAILKMLEDRKRKLAAEGLFDAGRKKALPFLPATIGVITSPTGAVIRDILHRLADRFPVHVMVWPVTVQGSTAAREVANAIERFNAMDDDAPDLLIVARGGGSFEDLMPFNEEIVVRAAAASRIPLIAAVGHETDVTLIDFAADVRAPTPTAAAEMAIPVRDDILATVQDWRHRMAQSVLNLFKHAKRHLDQTARALGTPARVLEIPAQRLDRAALAIEHAFEKRLSAADRTLAKTAARLRTPADVLQAAATRADRAHVKLAHALDRRLVALDKRLAPAQPRTPQDMINMATLQYANLGNRLGRIALFEKGADRLSNAARMLESLSFKKVLDRGYAVLRDADGRLISRKAALSVGQDVTITMRDGDAQAAVKKT